MTTEDDFQRVLDANPEDWQTRLVFADWLEERSDPRAAGYRALGVLGIAPVNWTQTLDRVQYPVARWCYHNGKANTDGKPLPGGILPADWLLALTKMDDAVLAMDWDFKDGGRKNNPATRREVEDATALAFAKLPPERRAELLNPTVPV